MLNLVRLKNFLHRNYAYFLLTGLIFFTVFFSAPTLLTRPRIWVDEAQTLELSRNFLKFGVLNAQISPGNFFEYPYLLQSTGYPLTVFLSALFNLFGYDFIVARIAMLVIMVAVLIATYFISEKFFGSTKAILSTGLLASFATFYGGGRTAVGDIPGFLFLLLFIYFWQTGKSNYFSGLFIGLAIVTKPSVFLPTLPALLIILAIGRSGFFKKTLELFCGMTVPALAWIFLILERPFSGSAWMRILDFYRNPYGENASISPIYNNLANFFNSNTLIYFALLLAIIISARFFSSEKKYTSLYDFIILYSFLAFVYYLRSPGWLRYVQIGEFLILLILPDAISSFAGKIGSLTVRVSFIPKYANFLTAFLIIMQFSHLLTSAKIYDSDSVIRAADYINENFPGASVGVMNSLALSALLETDFRYQSFKLVGIPAVGISFISDTSGPDVAIFNSGSELSEREKMALVINYKPALKIEGYDVYVLRSMQLE